MMQKIAENPLNQVPKNQVIQGGAPGSIQVAPSSSPRLTDTQYLVSNLPYSPRKPKVVCVPQQNIPMTFSVYLFDIQNPPSVLTDFLKTPSRTLHIQQKEDFTQLILLLKNPLSQNQLKILRKITALNLSNFWSGPENAQDFEALFRIIDKKEIFCALRSFSLYGNILLDFSQPAIKETQFVGACTDIFL